MKVLKDLVNRAFRQAGFVLHRIPTVPDQESAYLRAGRIPWGPGYDHARFGFVRRAVDDPTLLEVFRTRGNLPAGYGEGIDERCVEFPWLVSQLDHGPGRVLDAGSALNYAFALDHPTIRPKQVHIMTLAPEPNCFWNKGVSYLFGDLRDIPMRDAHYDIIVCLSTLEHIGSDNTLFTNKDDAREDRPNDFIQVMREFRRVLKVGGTLWLTVPFGKYRHYGAFQQFDQSLLSTAIGAFGRADISETFYRYGTDGWTIADAEECGASSYVEWVAKVWAGSPWPQSLPVEPDRAAAARAVACVRLRKV